MKKQYQVWQNDVGTWVPQSKVYTNKKQAQQKLKDLQKGYPGRYELREI